MNTIIRNIFAGYEETTQGIKPERGMIVTPSGQGRTESWGFTRGTITVVFANRESVSVYWHGIENEMKPHELCFTGEYQREDAPELVRTAQAAETEEVKTKVANESWLTCDLPGETDIDENGSEWEGYCAW